MNSDVSRADLLQYLAVADRDNLGLVADCFGYRQTSCIEPIYETINFVLDDATVEVSAQAYKPTTQHRPPEYLCRLTTITPSDLVPAIAEHEEIRLPDWITDPELTALDLNAPIRKAGIPPAQEPLVAWSRLWPVLRAILSEQQQKKRPDLVKLVKTIADGKLPTRIPQQQRQNWTAGLRILIDRPQRLRLFNHDYAQLVGQLQKLRGEVGLVQELLDDYPGGPVLAGNRKQAWRMPEPEIPLLILSDLGIYDESGQAEQQWLAFGRKLQAAGCKAYVLMPTPARYLSQELANHYRCISWDRFSALDVLKATGATAHNVAQRKRQDKQRLDEQLFWLSPLVELEPALLRAIRHRLFDKPLDVGFEALVWNHQDTDDTTSYLSVSAEKLSDYRDKFIEQARDNPAKAALLYALVKRYHAHKLLVDYYEEINMLAHAAGCADEVLGEAVHYLKQFVKAVHEHEQHGGLAQHSRTLLARQPEAIKRRQDFLSSLWGILQLRSDASLNREDWVDAAQALPFLNRKQERQHYRLVQQGENLYLGSVSLSWWSYFNRWARVQDGDKLYLGIDASFNPLLNENFSQSLLTIAEFDTCGSLLLEEKLQSGQAAEKYDHQLQEGELIELPLAVQQRRLHVNGQCYTLEAMQKPGWATAIGRDRQGLFVTVPWLNEPRLYWQNPRQDQSGQWSGHQQLGVDQYGLYADLTINNISQRFRWIEPGAFLMGSPKDEPERYDDEVQHTVTLTQGYWLADTAVTQVLWQAVMGNNPSRFKYDLNNPVEKVNWYDAQAFIAELNKLVPDINAKLPSEAQWEYACRAGTVTPFSFGGNITPELVNYHGKYPYVGADQGLYREKTVAVKSLPANPWGLYEMHGNVWEWCQDYWAEQLSQEPVIDPVGSSTGASRVVRGGSWRHHGRNVRSAYRNRDDAGDRNGYLGFRLALGLGLRPGQVAPEAEVGASLKDKLKKLWKDEP